MSDRGYSRRTALTVLAGGTAAVCWARLAAAQDPIQGAPVDTGPRTGLSSHRARWWKALGQGKVECQLCPHQCRVADRERGTCGVRENRGGTYLALSYARPCAIHLDPIEKKPFYHVLPGKTALSVGAPGCNIQCKFCQNWEISQVRPEQVKTFTRSPDQIVRLAKRRGAPTIAATYSEPVVWSEYVHDIGVAAKRAKLRMLMVSNGFIQRRPMSDLLGVLSAVKIDLKAYTDTFYRKQCGGQLRPVLDTLRLLAKRKVWTEIVVLVIPGLNDSDKEARALARFVRKDLGSSVPVHFTRFHPSYRLQNVPSTPVQTLTRVRRAAMSEGLKFVYVGNVPGHPGNHTYCPGCKKIVIRRVGMATVKNDLIGGKCPSCKRAIPGVWR
jgi:pyruvate formate lyase activating enzyme